MLASAPSSSSVPSAETEVRTRLEGAYEVLEQSDRRYGAAAALLSRWRYRRALQREPVLLSGIRETEGGSVAAREQAEAYLLRNPSSSLAELLDRVRARKAALHQLMLRKLRAEPAVSFEQALVQLEQQVFEPLPGKVRAGEQRLEEMKTVVVPAPVVAIVCVVLQFALLLQMPDPPRTPPPWLFIGFAGALLLAVLLSYLLRGSYTLTDHRLIWRPFLREMREVELKGLGSGKVVPRFGRLDLKLPAPFRLLGLYPSSELGSRIEALRTVIERPDLQSDRRVEAAIFPMILLAPEYTPPDDNPMNNRDVAVMRPTFVAHFPFASSGKAFTSLVGDWSAKRADLLGALEILRRLPDEAFDRAVQSAAEAHGLLLRRPEAFVASEGPIWSGLILRDEQHSLWTKVTWKYLEPVEAMVAKWRAT